LLVGAYSFELMSITPSIVLEMETSSGVLASSSSSATQNLLEDIAPSAHLTSDRALQQHSGHTVSDLKQALPSDLASDDHWR
jgi:hypothetical protein